MNQNDDYNKTSINVDYSSNKLPLWAKKGLKINNYDNEEDLVIKNNLVHRPNSSISSSTPISSNRTRISLYNNNGNNRSTDSDDVDENISNNLQNLKQEQLNESALDRLKKKQLNQDNLDNQDKKLNGGDYLDELSNSSSNSITINNKKKNPLYVSTENLKYNDNFFNKSTLPSKVQLNNNSNNNSPLNKPNLAQKPSSSVLLLNSTSKSINN